MEHYLSQIIKSYVRTAELINHSNINVELMEIKWGVTEPLCGHILYRDSNHTIN